MPSSNVPLAHGCSEKALCHRLLAALHLNVIERQSLPGVRARFSVMVAAVDEALAAHGWFPRPVVPGRDIGSGAVLEWRGGEVWLHEQHEVGVFRFGPVRSRRVSSVATAARAYIEANGGEPFDGVPIVWDA